jgi:hypothetical protein
LCEKEHSIERIPKVSEIQIVLYAPVLDGEQAMEQKAAKPKLLFRPRVD